MMAADLTVANNRIRQIVATLLTSGELVYGSCVKATVDEIYSVANYVFHYQRMSGGAAM
ncbi:hypothetical protein L195_g001184 [Trifolium pratense]|uniref:Uncharacterized protein n=1 Tax=Trifolium pratense TaxID=57577 RepID=A0A2K3NNZ6_TRIPR|nr:hypothetical protein L195_g001184 [Trifolium pratense]